MHVTCPHCRQQVTLPDSAGDQPTPCPVCGQTFTAPVPLGIPAPSAPAVQPPAAEVYSVTPPTPRPTPFSPPEPPAAAPASPPTPAPPVASARGMRFVLSRRVIRWFGPVAIFLIFLLTFFNWVGAYPGGLPVYTQSAWQVATGGFDADAKAETVFLRAEELRKASGVSVLMILTLLLLVLALPLALGDLVEEYVTVWIPDIVQRVWPYRLEALTGLAAIVFVALSLQLLTGIGLEKAATAVAIQRATPAPEAPDDGKRDWRQAEELSRLGVRRTGALWLAFAASACAVIGLAMDLGLARRGARPEPAVELTW